MRVIAIPNPDYPPDPDALAAADRPYKKAVSVERALDILDLTVKDGEIDANLFALFKTARIYEYWKTEPFSY